MSNVCFQFYISCTETANLFIRNFIIRPLFVRVRLLHVPATSNLNDLTPIVLVSKSPTQQSHQQEDESGVTYDT